MVRSKISVLVTLLITLGGPCAVLGEVQPAVATDRADYSPGSTVSISGVGFQPGETVRLQILQISTTDNGGQEHKPWQVAADGKGGFSAGWLVTSHEAGATLRLTAAGLASGRNAQVIFTDAAIAPASGGAGIPADSYNGAYTALTGPTLTETVIGDINLGTIVLTAPTGFIFDTNPPLPFITLGGDNNNKNINLLTNGSTISLTVTTNTLSFTVTSKSKGQTKNTLAYSDIRVRPTAATPLASGNITNTGTSVFPNSTANFGTLTEVAGTRTQLVVSGFPSPQIAGVPGSVTVSAQDQFGNPSPGYSGTVHFTSSDPRAVLPADYTFVSGDNGTHTFSAGVTLNTIGTQSITVSNLVPASFTGTQSGIAVVPAPADRLVFSTQPGSATYGSLLAPQPVVVSQDAFGNNSTVGLGVSKTVTLILTTGTGQLLGTTSLDIGTGAGNGVATFPNLTVNAVGAGNQLTASAPGLSNALSGPFSITPATVTVNVTVNSKVYDATTSATIATRALTGVIGGDNVTLTGGSATFATKTVANGKSVTVSGLSLSGTAAANYVLASTTVTTAANITPAALAVTGVSANNKIYDSTVNATLGGVAGLTGVISGDTVTLSGAASASFADKGVANNKPVSVTGYTLGGADAGNYTLTEPTLAANITAAGLTVSGLTANNKIYDSTTAASLSGTAALAGVLGSDVVSLSGTAVGAFANKTVGTSKPVTVTGLSLSGADAGNYALTEPTLTANITVAGLTVSGLAANNKTYDSMAAASLSGTAVLVGVLGTDTVSLSGTASAAFSDKAVGTAKPVTVSGLSLSGADAGNYTLTEPTLAANITAAGLNVSGITADNKAYDGTTAAVLHTGAAALVGVLGTDVVTLNTAGATGAFDDANVGTAKSVSVSGLSVSGADAANYSLTEPTTTADITAAGLTVTGIGASDKVYDGTTTATLQTNNAVLVGVQSGDQVTLILTNAAGTFDSKAVGGGKTVTVGGLEIVGLDAGKYTLTQPTTNAAITAATLTVTGLAADNKVYDGTTSATLNTVSAVPSGVFGSDVVVLDTGSAIGTFATRTVGTSKAVAVSGLTIIGADAANYTLTQPAATADITPAPLLVTVTAADKVYDGTTAASVSLSDDRVAGDSLAISYTTAAFADQNTGNNKIVNVAGISVTGTDAANYSVNSTAAAAAAITPASLTGIAGNQTRLYGEMNSAFTITYAGFVNGEDASLLTGTLSFSTAAGTNSPVGNYPILPSGQSAPNYTVQYVAGTLTVGPAPLLAKANNASRTYGQPNPDFTATITGFVNGEDTNVLGGTLTLTTTAQTNSVPGDYPIVPGGWLSVNYSITFSNGTLTITSTNQAPALAFITNAIVRPDELLMFKVVASDPDGGQLTYTLEPGAPAGAVLTNLALSLPPAATNAFFMWRPTRTQASTTNSITIRVTDDGGPPMSATQTFAVVVLDYLEIAIGSTNVQSGESATVPINLASSDGVTNLEFSIDWNAGYLSNAVLTVTAPAVAAASLQDNGTNLMLSFQAAPGQVLQGTQQLAQLTVEAVSNQFSAFVPLPIRNPSGAKPNGSAYDNYITPTAVIVAIEGEPLLLPWIGQDSARYLNLFGRLGVAYQLQYSTNVKVPAPWTPAWNYVQTNGVITIPADSLPPTVFYRIFRP